MNSKRSQNCHIDIKFHAFVNIFNSNKTSFIYILYILTFSITIKQCGHYNHI